MTQRLLRGLSGANFLRRHWQKQPLFVRHAMPHCADWLHQPLLFDLASRDDVESRIVMYRRGRWQVEHGPFSLRALRRMPDRGWTLLVQGVEQHIPAASALLREFSFIPHARLDDLMVSYAAPGGGVGPHFDSYDVFLLQGEGSRRWRISAQKDLALIDNAPLRLLKRFRAQREWMVEHGDLLYLPPRYAHEGTAETACITLSVGFRAPRRQELAAGFLDFLHDELALDHPDGLIEDPDLPLQKHPAELSSFLVNKIAHVINKVQWRAADVQRFSGCYLTEPKPQVVFQRPPRPLTPAAFKQRLAKHGARLALPTRMLFAGNAVFINGECHTIERGNRDTLIRLADTREAPAFMPSAATARLLHTWHCAGYIHV